MSVNDILEDDTEYTMISDMSIKPSECIECECPDLIKKTYTLTDRQDLGTPKRKRIQRHEKVYFLCKNCGKLFSIQNPKISTDTRYTEDVKEYVFTRVLEMGDSMHRVSSDLKVLHNVDLAVQTISEWVSKKRKGSNITNEKLDEQDISSHVDVITLDGTFKAVNPKKKDPAKKKGAPSFLHLTRLKNGQLAAFWEPGNE